MKEKCLPCEGIGSKLLVQEILRFLESKELHDWRWEKSSDRIFREFVFKNFVQAVDAIDKIAILAEKHNHHPDLHLTNYKKLKVELTTHALKGLTQNDFIVAAQINQLFD